METVPVHIPMLPQLEALRDLRIVVDSPEAKTAAQKHLTDVSVAKRALAQNVHALKKPHRDAVTEIDRVTRPWLDWLDQRYDETERALLAYQREVTARVTAEQQKLQQQFERKVTRAQTKAEAAGRPVPFVVPPPVLQAPKKTEAIGGATQTIVTRKAWRIPAPTHGACPAVAPEQITMADNLTYQLGIPAEFFLLDTARIGKIIRAGGTVAGIESYLEESIAVRTKGGAHE